MLVLVMNYLKYLDSHEWVKAEGNSTTVGITNHAHNHLGDVVYVELPYVGAPVSQGSSIGVVESVKVTNDINSPISGKVLEVNEELNDSLGTDCIGALDRTHIRVKVSNEDVPRYRGRKGYTTQNVLAACSFDLKFTYVLPGWEETASNSRIIKNTLTRNDNLKIPQGKFNSNTY
ncbi:glycine cleavage system H protein 2, mitochondrial-like isoform X5 [Quercus lobata]|uniref:glycine cleavage system H protein 2, mitochondrial-like isoform X5 n=1 Tax=Quercus lobata TaxID=97700 RepID=UPI001246BDE0|nr:glycine cleavage system H protein 2, mitochondrial-like isoform X5 [Quercus lobata]